MLQSSFAFTFAAAAAIRLATRAASQNLTSAWLDRLCDGSAPKPPLRCCLQAQWVSLPSIVDRASTYLFQPKHRAPRRTLCCAKQAQFKPSFWVLHVIPSF